MSRERQAFWSRLGVNTVRRTNPAEHQQENENGPSEQRTGPVWSIETARFGPETKVRFRSQKAQYGRQRYTVTLHDVSYGRVSGRTVRLIFDEHLEADAEGRALFEEMKRQPEAVGTVIKERLKTLTVDQVPMRRVYSIRMATDLWSLRSAPMSNRWFEMEPAEGFDADDRIGGALRLDRWIARAPKRGMENGKSFGFDLLVDAGRITSTLKLVFNGQVGYADRDAGRNVRLSFDQLGTWRVRQDGVYLNALAPELTLSDFLMRWQPVGGEPSELAPNLPPKPVEKNDPTPVADAEERAGPPAATGSFEMVGRSAVAPGDVPLVFRSRGRAPGLALRIEADARPTSKVLFRILAPQQIREGKIAPGRLRSEAALLTDWAGIDVTGDATAAAGPFKTLRGRLLERVDAPARMDNFDYAQCEGSISFGADFTAPASNHWRIDSPIGPIGFRGPEPDDDTANGAVEDPFRQRHGDQVQVVFFWGRQEGGPFVARNRPRTDWVEVNGVLREAAVTLEEADFNRLTFAPTSLTLLYTPGELPPPQTSYVRLAAPEDAEEIGQLDLSDAALVASRTDNLLGLTFRFGDMALSMQRNRAELVRRNASCRITTDRELDGSHDVRDDRPVLVVEFPGQHLFEEAFFRPGLQELPDVVFEAPSESNGKHPAMTVGRDGMAGSVVYEEKRAFLTALPKGVGWRLDPNDRQQLVDLLRLLGGDKARANFRTAFNAAKVEIEKTGNAPGMRPFASLSSRFTAALRGLGNVPQDQKVYIGPFALDPDVMRVARKAWREIFQLQLKAQAERLLTSVRDAAIALHGEARGLAPGAMTEEMRRIAGAAGTFEGALALEQRLETQFPSYQLFRTVYRDMVLDIALKGLDKTPPGSSEALKAFAKIADIAPEFIEATNVDAFGTEPVWMKQIGLTFAMIGAVRQSAKAEFIEALKGREPLDMPARGRIANPSRLAFRVRCRDGIAVARNRVETLDIPSDARAEEVRERLPFSLASLTRFSDFDLSVVRRAQAVYRPSETGQIDIASRRRLDLSQGARLDLLGFTSGPFVTSGTRLGEIAASLSDPPRLRETAIEIPARLTLSPDQNAVVVVNSGEVPKGIYCTPEKYDKEDLKSGCRSIPLFARRPYIPLWSADFLVGEVDPNLRAVHSPDLRPDVFTARVQRKLFPTFDEQAENPPYPRQAANKRFPGAGAPPRGPIAPWHLGRHETQTRALGVQDLEDPLPTQPAISRLYAYLSGEKKRRAAIHARDMKFRAAMDAYARHELVLLSSGWGLPVLGRRKPNGQLVADSGQSEPELRYRLADVEDGSALYEPRTLQTIELSLTPIGGTLRHASSFEPFAAAFDSHGEALFDAASVESWQQWTNLGRDVHCEIVYKGFLWPIGQRASLVQVTEREFFIDASTGAIRAVLRQRLFIRVGKAEKIFPALKQPARGRRFPVERLKNLTTQTPDIVDPSDDMATTAQEKLALPGGRIQLGQGAKGLVFWPRTAKLPAANVRFELDLDGAVSDMPLLFVDNVAANDPLTLAALSEYYNSLPTPDPLQAAQPQEDFDPITHVRTLDMGGGKRRYAAEKEAGSASVETLLWTLCATGLSGTVSRKDPEDPRVWPRMETIFRSDPVLQGADQPPFYPAVECCRIRVRQAERLIGRPLSASGDGQVRDERFLRAMPDAHYVEYGLPATTRGAGPVEYAIEGNVAEAYLAMIDQLQLAMGDKGDNAGGVYRPSGRVVGLSRSRGVLTWNQVLKPKRSLACDRLLSVAEAFEIGRRVPAPQAGESSVAAANLPSLCTEATPVVIDPNIGETIKQAQELYKNIVDGNAKILGLVSIKELFAFIEKLDPPSTGMPEMAEQVKYGAKEVQSAIGRVDDEVGDALSALDETIDLVRTTVIVPLAEAVHEIREGWDELDRDIAEYTARVPVGLFGDISFAKIFPDLHCTLVAFDAALARAIGAADAIAFTLAVSEVFAAGRRFLDALFRAASDPGRRIEAGLRGGIEGILELINVLQERRFELIPTLARAFLSDEQVYLAFFEIARYVSGETDDLPPAVYLFAEHIANTLVPARTGNGDAIPFPILILPRQPAGVSEEIWEQLNPTGTDMRQVLRVMIVLFVQSRGSLSLGELLAGSATDIDVAAEGLGERIGKLWTLFRADGRSALGRILTLAKARIAVVRNRISSLPDQVKAAADNELKAYEKFLDQFDEDDPAQAFKDWLLVGFEDEWKLIKDTEGLIREIVTAIQNNELEKAFAAVLRLARLHLGPLTGLTEVCEAVLKPVQEVVEAVDPARSGAGGIHTQIEAKLRDLKNEVDGLRTDVESGIAQVDTVAEKVADENLAEAVADLGLPAADQALADANAGVGMFKAELGAINGLIAKVETALSETLVDIEADKANMDALSARLGRIAALSCTPEGLAALGEVKGLHRDLRAMLLFRRAAMQRLVTSAEKLFQDARALLESPILQGTVTVVSAVAALNGLVNLDGLAEGIKTELANQRTTLILLQRKLRERADAYSLKLAVWAHQLVVDVGVLLEKFNTALEDAGDKPLVKRLSALLGAGFENTISDIRGQVVRYEVWLTSLSNELEKFIEAEGPAEDLSKLKFTPVGAPEIPVLDFFKTGNPASQARLSLLNAIEERLTRELDALVDESAVIFREVREQVVDLANTAIKKVLTTDIGIPLPTLMEADPASAFTGEQGANSLAGLYQQFYEFRNEIAAKEALRLFGANDVLFVEPENRPMLSVEAYKPYRRDEPDAKLDGKNDQLAGDVAWLTQLAINDTIKLTTDKSNPVYTFLQVFLDEWRMLRPTPVVIGNNVEDIVTEFLKGDLFAAIDFTDLRDQVEDYILSLVPTQIDMSYSYGVELGDKVRQATAGIFVPGAGSRLTIEAGIKIDLGFDKAAVHAKTVGRLGAFDVKLVGDAFDALTLKFNGATFTAETGKKMQFEIAYSDYEIGPMLEFVQQFQSFLSPKGNSGFYLEPQFSPLGVEAGYILNLGDFSVGAMAISNVGLATSAILPFEDKDARFKASLSTRMSPFTITYTPYGGSGFFAIEANANGVLGFEASFEFGGSAVFAFGPLTGQGRLMAGFYIRQSIADNGQKLTELSATFFVGGTAQIWIFSFAAALSVRLGMVNGNMSGEAIFSFSFSMGLADYEYSVVMYKKEAKGFNGQQQASLRDMPFGRSGIRIADIGLGAATLKRLDDNVPRIDTRTACQARNWRRYADYFTDDPAEDLFE